jgi:hypothetical protein
MSPNALIPGRPRLVALDPASGRPETIGDLFVGLIYTCQRNEANPLDYLT